MEMQKAELFIHRKITTPVMSARTAQIIDFSTVLERARAKKGAQRMAVASATAVVAPGTRGLSSIAPEDVERFLNHLRGEALLIGALSYDLGLKLSQLRFLRVRDVNLSARAIELSDGRRAIPHAIFEDLREHIHEKLCGADASLVSNKRDQLLFSHESFEQVLLNCASFFRAPENQDVPMSDGVSVQPNLGGRVRDNFLRVMGWFHTRRAARRGGQVSSPLGLFEKGPRIVRRDRCGAVSSYYLWRAV